jgi:hypothetical protein
MNAVLEQRITFREIDRMLVRRDRRGSVPRCSHIQTVSGASVPSVWEEFVISTFRGGLQW